MAVGGLPREYRDHSAPDNDPSGLSKREDFWMPIKPLRASKQTNHRTYKLTGQGAIATLGPELVNGHRFTRYTEPILHNLISGWAAGLGGYPPCGLQEVLPLGSPEVLTFSEFVGRLRRERRLKSRSISKRHKTPHRSFHSRGDHSKAYGRSQLTSSTNA